MGKECVVMERNGKGWVMMGRNGEEWVNEDDDDSGEIVMRCNESDGW